MSTEICSSPYGGNCRQQAAGGMRVRKLIWDDVLDVVREELVWLNLCADCAYWESDHDWDMEPHGPVMPRHVRRFQVLESKAA
jgi:hypothetical protein